VPHLNLKLFNVGTLLNMILHYTFTSLVIDPSLSPKWRSQVNMRLLQRNSFTGRSCSDHSISCKVSWCTPSTYMEISGTTTGRYSVMSNQSDWSIAQQPCKIIVAPSLPIPQRRFPDHLPLRIWIKSLYITVSSYRHQAIAMSPCGTHIYTHKRSRSLRTE
jgi:hypothetical protein